MRFLQLDSNNEVSLTKHLSDHDLPTRYTILSHIWSVNDEVEVTFADLQRGLGHYRAKAGYKKIEFCGQQATRDGITHFWVDTCCIDKANHSELSKAITSMFWWYQQAEKCYVHLSDVDSRTWPAWQDGFRSSRWFTRGWTLQELLAPNVVEFFSRDRHFLGTKQTLADQIHEATTIPLAALRGTSLSQFSVAERIRWTQQRHTKEKEDQAYCLLGIFSVFMPLIYGEGDNALQRLQKEINERHGAAHNMAKDVVVCITARFAGGLKPASRLHLGEKVAQRHCGAEMPTKSTT